MKLNEDTQTYSVDIAKEDKSSSFRIRYHQKILIRWGDIIVYYNRRSLSPHLDYESHFLIETEVKGKDFRH